MTSQIIDLSNIRIQHEDYASRRMKANLYIVIKNKVLSFLLMETETFAGPRIWKNIFRFKNNKWDIQTKSPSYDKIISDFSITPKITQLNHTTNFTITFPNVIEDIDPFYQFTIEIKHDNINNTPTIVNLSSVDNKLYLN